MRVEQLKIARSEFASFSRLSSRFDQQADFELAGFKRFAKFSNIGRGKNDIEI